MISLYKGLSFLKIKCDKLQAITFLPSLSTVHIIPDMSPLLKTSVIVNLVFKVTGDFLSLET